MNSVIHSQSVTFSHGVNYIEEWFVDFAVICLTSYTILYLHIYIQH